MSLKRLRTKLTVPNFRGTTRRKRGLRPIGEGRGREMSKGLMVEPGVPPMQGCHEQLRRLHTAQGTPPEWVVISCVPKGGGFFLIFSTMGLVAALFLCLWGLRKERRIKVTIRCAWVSQYASMGQSWANLEGWSPSGECSKRKRLRRWKRRQRETETRGKKEIGL